MSTQTMAIAPFVAALPAAAAGLALVLCTASSAVGAGPEPAGPEAPTDVAALMKRLGYRRTSKRSSVNLVYAAAGRTITLQPGSRRAFIDGTAVWMNGPALAGRSAWTVSCADAWWTLTPILQPATVLRAASMAPVVIDPGHGGSDTGAIGPRGLLEKEITLDLAQRLRERLLLMKIKTVLTRDRDATLTLTDRTDTARRAGAALFVSLHLNSSGNPASSGVETYALTAPGFPSTADGSKPEPPCVGNAFDAPSAVLAFSLHQSLRTALGGEDRGVRHARFAVLKTAPCPAALIESGFLSNPSEAARLTTPAYRDRLVDALADGICRYQRLVAEAQRPSPRD